jgi:hypothetical protein
MAHGIQFVAGRALNKSTRDQSSMTCVSINSHMEQFGAHRVDPELGGSISVDPGLGDQS